MKPLPAYRFVWGLGVASLVAILVAHLALTDIHHGEADVTLEWNILRLAFAVTISFHAAALLTLRHAIRRADGAT
jgi:hypothetical protein